MCSWPLPVLLSAMTDFKTIPTRYTDSDLENPDLMSSSLIIPNISDSAPIDESRFLSSSLIAASNCYLTNLSVIVVLIIKICSVGCNGNSVLCNQALYLLKQIINAIQLFYHDSIVLTRLCDKLEFCPT